MASENRDAVKQFVERRRAARLERLKAIGCDAAMAFIYRFGALLNQHVHLHCVVVAGVLRLAPRPS